MEQRAFICDNSLLIVVWKNSCSVWRQSWFAVITSWPANPKCPDQANCGIYLVCSRSLIEFALNRRLTFIMAECLTEDIDQFSLSVTRIFNTVKEACGACGLIFVILHWPNGLFSIF